MSGPGADELLHLLIALLNSCMEKGSHKEVVLLSISLSTPTSTWRSLAWLNISWRVPHRLSGVIHGCPLNLIASVASNLRLLIQFITPKDRDFCSQLPGSLGWRKSVWYSWQLFSMSSNFPDFLLSYNCWGICCTLLSTIAWSVSRVSSILCSWSMLDW